MSRFDDLYVAERDEDKAYLRLTYTNCGKSVTINNEYPFDVTWTEVLSDIVKTLEGSYGYSFRIDPDELGIWHDGKDNDA